MRFVLCIIVAVLSASAVESQHTVGLLSGNGELSESGYNLFYPFAQSDVFLIDACGEVVHTWPGDPETVPGNAAWLLENGNLVKGVRSRFSVGDPIWAGGGGETIEIRTWENDLLWSFTLNDSMRRMHHDFDIMPNGNILLIAWEVRTMQEAIDAGRDPSTIIEGELWPDMVIEVDPSIDSIVWEWHAWDHLVQDFDASKANYGEISAHPELIDLNLLYVAGVADWLHLNAIDYNPVLDLIALSSPHFGEAWVIDHSTTTEEAAGHSGGQWGRGGDLVYRWGNPQMYGRGDEDDQMLFYPHDVRWVMEFVDEDHPYYGSLSVFNNRISNQYSAAHVFQPLIDTAGRTFRTLGGRYLPQDFSVSLFHPDTTELYSPGLSSIQVLQNENYLVFAGRNGYGFELTPDGKEVVWEYVNPLVNGMPLSQGDIPFNNLVFRMTRYPVDYPAFAGKDLSPQGFLELNPDTAFCEIISLVSDPIRVEERIVLFPNPVRVGDDLSIQWEFAQPARCSVSDLLGRRIAAFTLSHGENTFNTEGMAPGLYVLVTGDPVSASLLEVR